jgi:hypothetical protein
MPTGSRRTKGIPDFESVTGHTLLGQSNANLMLEIIHGEVFDEARADLWASRLG